MPYNSYDYYNYQRYQDYQYRRYKEQERKEKKGNGFLNFLLILFILLCLAVISFNVYLRMNCICVLVDGSSMCDTLQDGDVLFINQTKNVKRGDIVVQDVTSYGEKFSGQFIIKRVIATEGDSLYCQDRQIYIRYAGTEEFVPLQESYVSPEHNTNAERDFETVTVEEGKIFLMGDNRDVSKDSRYAGAMSVENVSGVVPDWALQFKGIIKLVYGRNVDSVGT